jgi:hypothetical protein
MDQVALEQVRHRRQSDVRMRPHIGPVAGRKRDRPEVVEEDERADHLGRQRRQQPLYREAAEVARVGFEDQHDGSLRQ